MANSNDVANNNQTNYCFIFATCCIQSSVEKGNDSANRKKMRVRSSMWFVCIARKESDGA